MLLQGFNFLLLLFILKKYLYKPVLKILQERKKKIEEGLEFSEKMRAELGKSEKKAAEITDKARLEAQKIISQAKSDAKKKENEILSAAENEASEKIARANKEIGSMKQKMEIDLHKKAVEIASKMLEKMINSALSKENHLSVIDKKLKEVEKMLK